MRVGTGAAWLAALVVAAGGPGAGAQEPPGRLVAGELEARVLAGGDAEVTVTLRLAGAAERSVLPLRALAFGGVPRLVTAAVGHAGPRPAALQEVRPGALVGVLELPPGTPDTIQVRLVYRIDQALRRDPSEGGSTALLALPWMAVPWPPGDGAPGRVRLTLEFPGPVELGATFPAGFAPGARGTAPGGGAARWHATLPVLPSLTRAKVTGPGAKDAAAPSTGAAGAPGPGNPPAAPAPGFVFTGLFAAFLVITAGYALWMVRSERGESSAPRPGPGAPRGDL